MRLLKHLVFILILLNNPMTNGSNRNDNDKQLSEILNDIANGIPSEDTADDTKLNQPAVIASKKSNQNEILTTNKIEIITTQKSESNPAAELEHSSQWTMFFILCILGISILLIHVLIETNFHYLPESVAVVFLGAIIGLIFKLLSQWKVADWSVSRNYFFISSFFVKF